MYGHEKFIRSSLCFVAIQANQSRVRPVNSRLQTQLPDPKFPGQRLGVCCSGSAALKRLLPATITGLTIAAVQLAAAEGDGSTATHPGLIGGIEIVGLPSEGYGIGPTTFRIPGTAGYAERVAVTGHQADPIQVGVSQLYFELGDPVWMHIDGLRLYAAKAGAKLDRSSGKFGGAAIKNISVAAREGSAFEALAGKAGRNRSLISIDDVIVRVLGGEGEPVAKQLPGLNFRQTMHDRAGILIGARGVRLSQTVTGIVGGFGTGEAGMAAGIAVDIALETALNDNSTELEIAAVIRFDGVPQLRISADVTAFGSVPHLRLKGTISISDDGLIFGQAAGLSGVNLFAHTGPVSPDGHGILEGRLIAENLAKRLADVGANSKSIGDLVELLAKFGWEGGTVKGALDWPQ